MNFKQHSVLTVRKLGSEIRNLVEGRQEGCKGVH